MPKYTEYELRDASKVMGLEGFFAKELLVAYARIAELEGELERVTRGRDPFYWHRIKMAEDQAARDLRAADARGGEKSDGQ
ncbi:MAG TPA: hypothetical protein VN519_06390 [Bryobacteraceae bacterium]|nr:hypothetical protein [Bryobacteraceae bacterium]